MNCPKCGTEMVPMIMSSFCPRDCDRPTQTSSTSRDEPWMVHDTGECIAQKGREGGSWYVYHYPQKSLLDRGPFPPMESEMLGWWLSPKNTVKEGIEYLKSLANRGSPPGWHMRDPLAVVDNSARSVVDGVTLLIMLWVGER